jgi:hypothetical protein
MTRITIRKLGRFVLLGAILALFTGVITGCAKHVDKIGDINDSPGKYLNQNVTLAGVVADGYSLPLGISDIALYKLDDGTGTIWVVTHDGAPEKHSKLGITGVVKSEAQMLPSSAASLIGQFLGNVIDETQRRSQ